MPTIDYKLQDGTRVPGTTTIIGRFKESAALIGWAYKQGKQGLDLYKSRDDAAEAGTLAHDLVEQFLQDRETPPAMSPGVEEDIANWAWRGYEAFQRWEQHNQFSYVGTEMHLVSEKFRFGGTPDAVARTPEGELVMLDWKTSNGLYLDHVIQVAAYGLLVHECRPEWGEIRRYDILRFDKRDASFHHHSWHADSDTIQKAIRAFKRMRPLYDDVKDLAKVIR